MVHQQICILPFLLHQGPPNPSFTLDYMKFSSKTSLFVSRIFIFCTIGIIASSCLTFEESYSFNKDGSGTMEYTIDMSEISSMIKMAQAMDTTGEVQEITLEDKIDKIKDINGITGVMDQSDSEKGILKLSFDFKDLDVLNEALIYVLNDGNAPAGFKYFTREGKTIHRRYHAAQNGLPGLDELGDDENAAQAMAMINSMEYTVNLNFVRPVAVVYATAEVDIEGAGSKSVSLNTNFKDILEDSENLGMSVVLR